MKKKLLILFIAFIAPNISADEVSSQLITKVKSKLSSSRAYRVTFTSDYISGNVTVSGYKFAIISPEAQIHYDGQTLWNFDVQKNEVNIENLSPTDPNVMVNPSKLLSVNEADFTHRHLGNNSVELTPTNNKTIYSKIVIHINPTSSLPESITITDRETGDQGTILVSAFTPNVATTDATFKFDPSKHRNIDVVDFR